MNFCSLNFYESRNFLIYFYGSRIFFQTVKLYEILNAILS